MPDHPYRSLPAHCFWRENIASPASDEVDPVVRAKFKIGRDDQVATAGSCFAQHIARHLRDNGFRFLITEAAHPIVHPHDAAAFGYGVFTARYGNIYTTRQLAQLLNRAYGVFRPVEDVWRRDDGRLLDPFRPQIQPDGFATQIEFGADRAQHFAAVRRAVEEMDVLVLTLGLTECWQSRQDGATYPLCPGVAGGTFDPSRHVFRNLSVTEVVQDLHEAVAIINTRNKRARIVLTVSPIPLIATFEDRSVLVSTTYSKSVLRVACDEVASRFSHVSYFPSYEIITGNHARGTYFASDLRSVTESGVAHVMRLFMKHYGGDDADPGPPLARGTASWGQSRDMEEVVGVICDEEALAQR